MPTEQLSQTNDGIHLHKFSGRVVVKSSKLCQRNSRKWEDKSEVTVINGQIINFDAWAEGEEVKNGDQENNVWFRVADTDQWLPKVYIHQD